MVRLQTSFQKSRNWEIDKGTKALEQHRPSYVIFDLGNVLVHIDPAAFLRSLSIDTPDNRNYYQSKVTDIVKRYESGEDSTDHFFANLDVLFNGGGEKLFHRHDGKKLFSPGEFRNAMLSIVGSPVAGMEEIVRRVSTAVPVGLLSNTNPVHFEYCLQTFHALQHIPSLFLSYQLKALKPEPKIFALALSQIPLLPREILYIDDLAENVEAARNAGLMAHHFVGVENIERLFSDLTLI